MYLCAKNRKKNAFDLFSHFIDKFLYQYTFIEKVDKQFFCDFEFKHLEKNVIIKLHGNFE